MEALANGLATLDGWLGSAVYFPFLLLGVGVFFTFYLGFPQIRFFGHAWRVVRGKYAGQDDPGDTTHFEALSTALSGTVGTGNIAGVAFAIYLGGPAALFWMWMTAFLGMTTKYVEVTISHKYRVRDAEGRIAGGPMYFMERGLNMKWLAVIFAIAVVISSFGSGNMPQSNSMAAGLEASFGLPAWITGAVLAVMLGMVIIGGIRRIAVVAAAIVPFMGVFYALGALAVVASNYEQIIPAFLSVFSDALGGSGAVGGFLGATFAYAFNRGVNRGLFSNEAGQGSAPIAHATARTEEPVAEGMVAILEPFIDTLLICTLTGLVILSSGVWHQKFENDFASFDTEIVEGIYLDSKQEHTALLFAHLDLLPPSNDPVQPLNARLTVTDGRVLDADFTVLHNRSIAEDVRFHKDGVPFNGVIEIHEGRVVDPSVSLRGLSLLHSVPLTVEAFKQSFLGDFGQYAVTLGLVLFAFSTALAWSYYGDRAVTYLFGIGAVQGYRIVYVIAFFIATIADTSMIWLLSAVTLALMTIPNLIGIMLMRKEIKALTTDYWQRFRDR